MEVMRESADARKRMMSRASALLFAMTEVVWRVPFFAHGFFCIQRTSYRFFMFVTPPYLEKILFSKTASMDCSIVQS